MLSTDDNNEIFWCKRAWKNFFPPAYSSGNFAHVSVCERDAARRRIIFIRDRLRQNKKEVHLPIFSSFPSRLRARNFSFFWRHQGGSLWPSCLFFLFQACRSQYAARACSVRAKNISAQPFLDCVMCVCVCIVPLAGYLLLLDVRLIIHAKCKKTMCKPSITDQLSSAAGKFYFYCESGCAAHYKIIQFVRSLFASVAARPTREGLYFPGSGPTNNTWEKSKHI